MRLTIQEAIDHCYDVINQNKACEECQEDHKQLIEWLEELRNYRKNDPSYTEDINK